MPPREPCEGMTDTLGYYLLLVPCLCASRVSYGATETELLIS